MSTKSTKNSLPSANSELGERFGERYFQHQPIAPHTSIKLGGIAEHLVVAKTMEELMAAAQTAFTFGIPYTVLGAGSGVLVSEVGYPGLVIINRTDRIMFDPMKNLAVVDSGVGNDRIINQAAGRGLGGLEFLAAIPGTVGGAVATNATWGDRSTHSAIKELVIYLPEQPTGKIVTVTGAELPNEPYQRMLGELSSAPPVILTIRLQLANIDQAEMLRRLALIRRHQQKFKNGWYLGSVFLQPIAKYHFPAGELAKLKLKGLQIDRTDYDVISRTHPKVGPTEVRQLIGQIKTFAKEAGVLLDERVHYLGYWPNEEQDEPSDNSPDA